MIRFMNDFVIEKGFGKVSTMGAGRCVGERQVGSGLGMHFFISKKLQ
jgi:hypothetical protein